MQPASRTSPRRIPPVVLCALAAVVALLALAPAAHAATVTLTAVPTPLLTGQSVVVGGSVDPAAEGQEVALDLDGVTIATLLTDATGAFSATLTPERGGQLVARLVADGSTSPPVTVAVMPRYRATVVSRLPFGVSRVRVNVNPSTYRGRISYRVLHNSRVVASGSALAGDGGKAVLRFRTPGVGRFTVKLSFAAHDGLAQRTGSAFRFTISGQRIAVGTRGPQVECLLRRLAYLRIRVPGISRTLSFNARDSIMAFQKAYRLPRTYVFDADDWRKLDTAKVVAPRSRTPKLHIEIDKTRQILMVVKDGKVFGLIAISSGATGNTPEGWHRILWKAPATTSWLGAGVLYRTMTFHGNFAIHGYDPVPPYPASHGCVREPNWVANWTYVNSYVGEAVYVYR